MTTSRSVLFRLQEQETDMYVELGDDGKYPVTGLGFISFHMLAREVLELCQALYVLGRTKNLLLVSCLIDLKCNAKFNN
jgi:hypothetical protein